MRITFLGATGTVTGSKFLVQSDGVTVLVDCGLFQGTRELRERNWRPLPIDPADIDAVILTHAHIDHSGYLPRLVRDGFGGPVFCTPGTRDLSSILLPDAGHLQEEEARNANKYRYSRHDPALPLFTQEEAEHAVRRLVTVDYASDFVVAGSLRGRMGRSGHIVGAAFLRLAGPKGSILFSGDLGRPNDAMMRAPEKPPHADVVLVESTYGDRLHSRSDPKQDLADVVNRTIGRGGHVIVPAFAVGRAQSLLYYLYLLRRAGAIPDVPVFLNSPMAIDATDIFFAHRDDHRLSDEECRGMARMARYVRTTDESKALNVATRPMIVIAGSGMATGGRVLHHLKAFGPDPRNTVLFAGYQASGTRGAKLLGGAATVKIHGMEVPIRAEVAVLDQLSAHSDYEETLLWLQGFPGKPRKTFVIHGEPSAAAALEQAIANRMRWDCSVPSYGAHADL